MAKTPTIPSPLKRPIPSGLSDRLAPVLHAAINDLATIYGKATGIPPERVWRKAVSDPRYRTKYPVSTRVYDSALRWFADNWPEAAKWPDRLVEHPADKS